MTFHFQTVAVVVKDRRRAAKWYQQKLGFQIVFDDKEHWMQVGDRKTGTGIHLCEARGKKGPNRSDRDTGIQITIKGDFERQAVALKKKGVTFTFGPKELPWGWVAKFLDMDGNELWLAPFELP
jgi:predicted enzyme related to lactoylglutathione lyase